ncbi:DDE-type integrase/transposase/recombinase [Streptomyces sp. NPDC005236]|uniref:DDE-type integrase/transposase/recombinase n=1 Tax=Streptomyces sp. NPDC005236 TaxID=3157028 RepID=UPI0033B6C9BB
MSYDLAVWDGDRPLDDDQAGSTYDELYERYLESDDVVVPLVPRIVAYVDALVERYPDDVARSVWASPPVIEEASGPRRVVGWATADHLRTDLVADALTAACRQRRPIDPVIFHSDRGCQYTSQQLGILASQLGVRLSVGRTGQCWDNALAESFFATIKRELLDTTAWPSRATARTAIFDFIEGTTCTVCTAASATAAPRNTRPHSQSDHHTDGVRQSGTSSNHQQPPRGRDRRSHLLGQPAHLDPGIQPHP